MSLSYELFSSMESADATPKTIDAAVNDIQKFFTEFKEQSEEIVGRLYAMIKKLTGDGSVNTEIKYLKVRILNNPSQLVTRVSERVLDEILFNEQVCKYDEKQLNHPIAKRCCEEHLAAIKQVIDMEKSFKQILSDAAKTTDKADDKSAIRMLKNLKQVSKHLIWSSRRLLANVRMKASSEALDADTEPVCYYTAGTEKDTKAKSVFEKFDPKKPDTAWELHTSVAKVKKDLDSSTHVNPNVKFIIGYPRSLFPKGSVVPGESGMVKIQPKETFEITPDKYIIKEYTPEANKTK